MAGIAASTIGAIGELLSVGTLMACRTGRPTHGSQGNATIRRSIANQGASTASRPTTATQATVAGTACDGAVGSPKGKGVMGVRGDIDCRGAERDAVVALLAAGGRVTRRGTRRVTMRVGMARRATDFSNSEGHSCLA